MGDPHELAADEDEHYGFTRWCFIEHFFPGIGSAGDLPLTEYDARWAAVQEIRAYWTGEDRDPQYRMEREARRKLVRMLNG